jgi:hypothetical protein
LDVDIVIIATKGIDSGTAKIKPNEENEKLIEQRKKKMNILASK